jgi:hypothetical protein
VLELRADLVRVEVFCLDEAEARERDAEERDDRVRRKKGNNVLAAQRLGGRASSDVRRPPRR